MDLGVPEVSYLTAGFGTECPLCYIGPPPAEPAHGIFTLVASILCAIRRTPWPRWTLIFGLVPSTSDIEPVLRSGGIAVWLPGTSTDGLCVEALGARPPRSPP